MFSKAILTALTVLSLTSVSFAQSTRVTKKKVRSVSSDSAHSTSGVTTIDSSGSSTTTYVEPEKSNSYNAAISEYAYQPQAGHVAFTATPSIVSESSSALRREDTRATTTDTRSNLIMLRAQRGLTNNWSWDVGFGAGSADVSPEGQDTAQAKGITDISFGVQKLKEISIGQMFYGVQGTFSPADRDMATAYKGGTSTDGNLFSGGHSLAPFVGVEMDRRHFIVGGTAKFQYMFDRSANLRGADGTKITLNTNDGHVLSTEVFIEKPMPKILFGAKASVSLVTASDTDAKVGGFKTEYSTSSFEDLGLGVYAKISPLPTKSLDILPSLSLNRTMGASSGSLSLQEVQEVSLAVSIRTAL